MEELGRLANQQLTLLMMAYLIAATLHDLWENRKW